MKNKRRLILIGCLAIIGLLALQVFLAKADEITLKERLKFDSSVPFTAGIFMQDNSNSISPDMDGKVKNDLVLSSAEELIGKAESEYLVEGWLHISSTTESFMPASPTLPDGSPTPTKWTDDLWVLLDKGRSAVRAVTVQNTGDPTTSQVTIFEEGIWTNITLGFSSTEPESYKPSLDNGFLASTLPYKDTIALDIYDTDLNGQIVTAIVSSENYKNPITLLKDSKENTAREINGITNKYYFSLSGLPIQVDQYYVNSDGSMIIFNRISGIVVERIDNPPADVLNYFNQK